jgi:hypothetical protein
MTPQLDLFASRLPYRPYCTDTFDSGLRVRPLDAAIHKRYIQVNPPAQVGYLVFDVDREGAAFAWESGNLPPPSIVAVNPENGQAHLFYAIENPVTKTDSARMGPIRYLAAVQSAMTAQLGADRGYSMLIAKNPLNPSWRVLDHSNAIYGLSDLADHVDLTCLPKPRCRAEISGLGRNCDLFDSLRAKAYRTVAAFRDGGTFETWGTFILDHARSFNTYYPTLPDNEVKATAKSVAKWVWRHFGNGAAAERFSNRQRQKQVLSARARHGATAEKVVRAVQGLQRNGKRVTVAAVARLVGVSRQAIDKGYKPLLDSFPMLDQGTWGEVSTLPNQAAPVLMLDDVPGKSVNFA